MLESSDIAVDSYLPVKCGEIYYDPPSIFNVACALCEIALQWEEFPSHFLSIHLSVEEEHIAPEILDREDEEKIDGYTNSLDDITHNEEIPDDAFEADKALEYILAEDSEDEYEHNTCLEDLILGDPKERENLELDHASQNIDITWRECSDRDEFQDHKETTQEIQFSEETRIEIVASVDNAILSDESGNFDEIEQIQEAHTNINEIFSDTEAQPMDQLNCDKIAKEMLAFPCSECNNSYHTEHGLKVHIRKAHDPNKPPAKPKTRKPLNKCLECGVICRTSRDLTAHMLKHTGIFCDVCGRSFAQTAHLTRHKIRHSGVKNFICEQCEKAFFTAKELKAHMICHSSVMPVICEICGKGCRNETVLNAHMRRHTGERPAKCDVCEKRFFSWHDLKIHAVAHTDERPFECDICGSTFQRKKALRVHKLRHSDNPKHVCQICGKGFGQAGGLNAHMRTHDTAKIKTASNKGETFEEVVHSLLTSFKEELSDSE